MGIGVGIIGWGAISEILHGPCLAGMEECEFVAVCDEREERLSHAKEVYGCKGYKDIDAFLEDPDIHLVLVALPNFLHGPTTLRSLEAGKHAISEKPMAFGLAEAENILRTARKNELIVTTHQNRRWDPYYLMIQEFIDEGRFGNPVFFQSRALGGPWKKTWAGSSKLTGKGPFMSFGPHLLDQMLTLAPQGPIFVSGVVKSILAEDDYFNAFLTFSDGSTALIELSKATRLKGAERFHISFEKGDLMVTTADSETFWWHLRGDGEKAQKEKVPEAPPFPIQSRPFYQNVFAAIRGEEPLIVKPEQTRRYAAVAEAIVRSSEEKKSFVVSCDEAADEGRIDPA